MVRAVPLASPISRDEEVFRIVERFRGLYPEAEITEVARDEKRASELSRGMRVLGIAVTGGTESLMGAAARASRSFLAVYHGSLNSLPAVLEASAEYGFMFADIEDRESIRSYIRASEIADSMKSERVVLLGDPSPWLVYSGERQPAADLFGEIEKVSLSDLERAARSAEVGDVKGVMGLAQVSGPDEDDFRTSMRIEGAIRSMLESRGARVFSIRCFDIIGSLKGTACLALSRLNDEGYVAACEGDLAATATMYVLSRASGLPSFMGNVVSVKGNRILIAHCTSPTRILSEFRYMTHFESGIGVGIAGRMAGGTTVTYARIDMRSRKVRAGTGRVVEQPFRDDICRTQVLIESHNDPSAIVRSSTGNHYALTPGDHLRVMEMLAYVLGYSFERV
ncbi:MAG: L-arabinose isomerase family protein [Nitrososphaeria archaeon]